MSAFAYYDNNKFDDAINGLDRFIQLHPGNRDAAYAYYMRALCYYEQVSDIKRDQGMTEKALARKLKKLAMVGGDEADGLADEEES